MEALDVGNFELLSVHSKENGAAYQKADAPPENILPASAFNRPVVRSYDPPPSHQTLLVPLGRLKLVLASLCPGLRP